MTQLDKMTQEQFGELIRDALNKLYDTLNLAQHPLINILTSSEQASVQRSRQLRQILLNGIEQLRPETGTPAQSPDWRAYYILEKRYIDGMSISEICREISISRAQLFRNQAHALDIMIEQLWEKVQQSALQQIPEILPNIEKDFVSEIKLEMLDVITLIDELKPIIGAILTSKDISFSYDIESQAIILPLDRVIFRQIFLALINALVSFNQGGKITIAVFKEKENVSIYLDYSKTHAEPEEQQIAIARKLASHLDAEIEIEENTLYQRILLNWSNEFEQQQLLVVDDNIDISKLFKRYLSVLGWKVKGVSSVFEALQFLEIVIPTAIILDVMMPDADGWELLLKLKANSDTQDIPIIVCSAVHNRDTAIALGANAYLTKPVTQENIMLTLQPLINN